MKIIAGNIAILDEPDQLCAWVEEAGRLDHDGGIEKYYLRQIHAGDVVIDAGAAIGDHTIAYLKQVGANGTVHAFECNPKMLDCLAHNCPSAIIHSFAISDKIGMLELTEVEGNAGGNYVSKASGVSVYCVSLDDFGFPRVDFIKWDIEGHEVQAINGATETILRCRPRMIVEFNEPLLQRSGFSCAHLERVIRSLGYTVECIMGSREEGRYEGLCLPI